MDFLQFDELRIILNGLGSVKIQVENKQGQMDVFCSKYSNSEAPISVIAKILSENYSLKLKNISNEFEKAGFTKVKHLAQATVGKVRSMQLSGNSLKLLNGAMKIYSKRFDDFLKSAGLEFEKGNFYNTQRLCKELLLHKPTDMDVIMLKSSSFFKNGNYDECIDCLLVGKNIDPNCTIVLYNLAVTYWEKSDVDLSKKYLSEVCRLEPTSVDKWFVYAEMLRKTKDYIKAELTYVHALSIKPEQYEVHNSYGELLYDLNKIEDAKKQFKIALDGVKARPKALNNLGFVYSSLGKFKKAISYFERALEINPHLKYTRDGLGLAYLKVEENQKATVEFLKQLKIDPNNLNVLRNLAVAYCRQGNNLMSATVFKKCLKIDPEHFGNNLDLALIYFANLKNYEEAIIYFKKCIELNPKNSKHIYFKLVTAYKENDEPIHLSDTALILGDLYLESDELDNASRTFICALCFNPENAICHWKVGLIMYTQGNLDKAFSRYKNAIELNPDLKNYKCEGKKYYDKYKKYMESRLDKYN